MGFGANRGSGRNGRVAPAAVAEINVTPMVDVMLVLLVIFMIASSVQSFESERQNLRLRDEQSALEQEQPDQMVDIDLPKTNLKAVNLAEDKKLVLSFSADYSFYIGARKILVCSKSVSNWPAKLPEGDPGEIWFRKCVSPLVEKLLANEKLKEDGELYLRADRSLRYGHVLILMAKVRRAGIHKFGLIAEEEGS
jgi:biopolymer transport protein ExbD